MVPPFRPAQTTPVPIGTGTYGSTGGGSTP